MHEAGVKLGRLPIVVSEGHTAFPNPNRVKQELSISRRKQTLIQKPQTCTRTQKKLQHIANPHTRSCFKPTEAPTPRRPSFNISPTHTSSAPHQQQRKRKQKTNARAHKHTHTHRKKTAVLIPSRKSHVPRYETSGKLHDTPLLTVCPS